MDSLLALNRRSLVRLGLSSAAAMSQALTPVALAQDAGPDGGKVGAIGGRSETELFPGQGLAGGGQLEIRLTATTYTNDPDQLEVALRMKPYNLDSWMTEWTRVAEKNEKQADSLAAEGRRVTANEYYLRASNF